MITLNGALLFIAAWVVIGAIAALYLEIRTRRLKDGRRVGRVRKIQMVLCPLAAPLFGVLHLLGYSVFRTAPMDKQVHSLGQRIAETLNDEGRWTSFYPEGTTSPYLRKRMAETYPNMKQDLEHADKIRRHAPHMASALDFEYEHLLDTRTNTIIRLTQRVHVLDADAGLDMCASTLIKRTWRLKESRERESQRLRSLKEVSRRF